MTDLPTKGGSNIRKDRSLPVAEQASSTEPVAQRAAETVADQSAPPLPPMPEKGGSYILDTASNTWVLREEPSEEGVDPLPTPTSEGGK